VVCLLDEEPQIGIDLLGLFAFGDRLIGRTSDSGSENPGSTPGPQASSVSPIVHAGEGGASLSGRGNGLVPCGSLLGSNRFKSSNGSKRFERLERLERFERTSEGLLLDVQ
jgi:hypothetical protein